MVKMNEAFVNKIMAFFYLFGKLGQSNAIKALMVFISLRHCRRVIRVIRAASWRGGRGLHARMTHTWKTSVASRRTSPHPAPTSHHPRRGSAGCYWRFSSLRHLCVKPATSCVKAIDANSLTQSPDAAAMSRADEDHQWRKSWRKSWRQISKSSSVV